MRRLADGTPPAPVRQHATRDVGSVLVVVLAVGGVLVPVVHVVDVVVVRDGLVTAVRSVGVVCNGVLCDALMLVVVIAVDRVVVGSVHVVDVTVVLNGLVSAVGAVLILGDGVLRVDLSRAHQSLLGRGLSLREHGQLHRR